jgi:hypothetical protein
MHTIALVLILAGAPAQTVFKCTDANGISAYSAKPCSEDPAKVTEVAVRKEKDGDPGAARANFDAMRRSNDWADIQRNAETCVRGARERIFGMSNQRIAGLNSEIARMEQGISMATNDVTGATWANGLRQQIAGIQQAIATERTSADQLFATESARCDTARTQAEQRHRAQNAPAQP